MTVFGWWRIVDEGAREHFDQNAQGWNVEANKPNSRSSISARHFRDFVAKHMLRGRALDIGCGPGLLTAELTRIGFDTFATDISKEMVSLAICRLSDIRSDAGQRIVVSSGEEIPFGDVAFDLIALKGVFPYIADHPAYLNKILSRLTPHGYVAASSTNRCSLYVLRGLCKLLREFRPDRYWVRTVLNLLQTGMPSGDFLHGSRRRQARNARSFDALFYRKGFTKVDDYALYDIVRLDRTPFQRRGVGKALARWFGWYYTALYKRLP